MATVGEHSKGHRVSYVLTSMESKNFYIQKYYKTKAQARQFAQQIQVVETATKTGLARFDQLQEWIGRGWITEDQATRCFAGYDQIAESVEVDLDTILNAYKDYAISNSKAKDASRKTYRTAVGQATKIVDWLRQNSPQLDLTAGHVEIYLDNIEMEGASSWTVHHYLTKFRIVLDQAIRLKMIDHNVARDVTRSQPKTAKQRRILTPEEAQCLLAKCEDYREPISGCLPTIVMMGLYCGLRNEEMAWCQWDWMNLKSGILTVKEVQAPSGEVWVPKDAEKRNLDVKDTFIKYWRSEQKRQEKAGILGPFVIVGGNLFNKQQIFRHGIV